MPFLTKQLRSFTKREDGTTMVEFAIVISLFLLIVFAILDFGRLGYTWVASEKAMQISARVAAVRPAVCAGVPFFHQRRTGDPGLYPAGTMCRTNGGICVEPTPVPRCTLAGPFANDAGEDTADEIWNRVQPLLPSNVERNNIQLTYAYNRQLGFIGGPYVPMITAELLDSDGCNGQVCFQFVTPLSALAAVAAPSEGPNGVPVEGGTIPFPNISATLPGEDLNQGVEG